MSLSLQTMRLIQLNIGGKLFTTTYDTINNENSMLKALVNNPNPAQLIDGAFFIDRDYSVFHYILNFLRGSRVLPKKNSIEFKFLQEEADYYGIDRLHRCLYHINQPDFQKYDLVSVSGNKYTVISVDEFGYVVSKNQKRFRIDSVEDITPTKIEINDDVIIYKDGKWLNGYCQHIPSEANNDYFTVVMCNGVQITAKKHSNCVRY